MTDYTELVKALRWCKITKSGFTACRGCPFDGQNFDCEDKLHEDAAAAIEELQQKWFKSETDATNLTGRLAQAEAEIERLKEVIDELREAQTYIDHYGDKWMTSAKDVPTSAYNHGYMDGKNEAQPHWVSVEERLPEKECDLLFVVHTPAYHDIGFDEDMPPETKCVYGSFYPENHRGHRWWSWKEPFDGGYEAVIRNEYSEEPEFGSKTYITHWMPLPEPPQEVQE